MSNQIDRRSVLKGLAGILLAGTAPFFVPSQRLMRVKPIVLPYEYDCGFNCKIRLYDHEGILLKDIVRRFPLSPKHRDRQAEIQEIASLEIFCAKGKLLEFLPS